MQNAPIWNLDSIFPGDISGSAFKEALESLEVDVDATLERLEASPPVATDVPGLLAGFSEVYELGRRARPIRVCADGVANAQTDDPVARMLKSRLGRLQARLSLAYLVLEDHVASMSEDDYGALSSHADAEILRPRLENLRATAAARLSRVEGELLTELSQDGIHAWGRHYQRISGRLKVPLSDGSLISVGRAKNLLGSRCRDQRRDALDGLNQAWSTVEEDCATVLSHIVGTRVTLNRRRGRTSIDDSLDRNRMGRESLEAMLEAARRAAPLLERYLALKARWLGVEAPGFEDMLAPLGKTEVVTWETARAFVETHFAAYHDDLAGLARRAFEERWVEAEDRENKRDGAYCAGLGSGASRVFMTFGGTWRSTTTLAHELGHAYHNWVLRDAHMARIQVPSTLAETASILSESLVRDAALASAESDIERVAMLDARLTAGVTYLMNLPFRYQLEVDLHEMRAKGELDPQAINEACVERQKEHYRGRLSSWFPRFWADKAHFFISHFAFYNYPYTFGYLFSGLVYARVKDEGPSFHRHVVDLLQRSGYEYAEPLALDTLGVDLRDPDTWCAGWAPLKEDLAALEALTDQA